MRARSLRCTSRRAAAGFGAVVMLVVLQLVLVGVVVSGARDQDMSVHRNDSARAFYAAEGVTNMALAELSSSSDFDNDGMVGSISADGNSANDPVIGGAPASVNATMVSGNAELVATARANASRRQITATGTPGFRRRVIYSSWGTQEPQYRVWNGSGWAAAADTMDFQAKQYWAVIERCPVRAEVIIACSLQVNRLRAAVQTVNTWDNLVTATTNVGTTDTRPFAFAYEQTSGDGLLIYRSGNSATINYRTWDGSAWSAQNTTTSPLTGNPTWMRAFPKPGSNEITLVVLDSNNDIAAFVWNGSAWIDKTTLETSAPGSDKECVSAAYQGTSGHCVVVWGRASTNSPQQRVWNGSSWSSVTSLPSIGATPLWVKVAADRNSNKLLFGVIDSSGRINLNNYDGSAWGSSLQATANASSTISRCFDVAFEPTGSRGLAMWGHNGVTTPRYRSFDGSSWSNQSSAPALPSTPLLVQFSPSGSGNEIMTLVNITGGQNSLQFLRWSGAGFGMLQQLDDNVSGPSGAEVFMIPTDPPGVTSIINAVYGWTEAAPQ